MRKHFTFGALAMFALSMAAADKPSNEAFYVVGTMNGWDTPDFGSSNFMLTDKDGDGIYTGEMEINTGQLEFKLFSEPEGWSSQNYYGYSSNITLLKAGTSVVLQPGWESYNITIGNWVPGVLSLSAEWVEVDDTWLPKLTLNGSNQPEEIVKPSNEAFYLVGDMTDWEIPTEEDVAGWKYKLTDEDGDGEYSGSFDIPAGKVAFSLFSTPDGTWFSNSCYRLRYNQAGYLFADEQLNYTLTNGSHGNYNLTIDNWMGGEMAINVKWITEDELDWHPVITISGKNQPTRPGLPEVFIIGDFNNWTLPTAIDLNGAIKVDKEVGYSSDLIYESQLFDFEAQETIKFGLCQLDPKTGNYSFFVPQNNVPFTLYAVNYEYDGKKYPYNGYLNFQGEWSPINDKGKYAMTLNDWRGGTFGISLRFPFNEEMLTNGYITAQETPIIPDPEQMYYIVDIDGNKECYTPESFTANRGYWIDASGRGKKVSIILSSENSITPAPENCWGIESSLEELETVTYNTTSRVSIVKGGKPISWNFPFEGKLFVIYSYLNSTAEIYLESIGGPFKADKIYVCGDVMTAPDGITNGFTTPSVSNQTEYDKYWKLEETAPGVFSGTYYVYKNTDYTGIDALPQFRFFKDLMGWSNEASLGSDEWDFYCLPVLLEGDAVSYQIYQKGLGNWAPCTAIDGDDYVWKGGWVKMIIDTNYGYLTLQLVDSGVEEIQTESVGKESWYNLQGIKVDRPEKGMYIHVVNGKSRVEVVK